MGLFDLIVHVQYNMMLTQPELSRPVYRQAYSRYHTISPFGQLYLRISLKLLQLYTERNSNFCISNIKYIYINSY